MIDVSQNAIYNDDRTVNDFSKALLRFFSNRDRFYKNLSNVPKLEGYEDIGCHADPYSFGFQDPDTDELIQEVSAKWFAQHIKDTGKYKGGSIRLIACESGKLDNGLAQQFADEMGVKVLAPTKSVYTDDPGYMVLADSDDEAYILLKQAKEKWNPDGWKTFEPKR